MAVSTPFSVPVSRQREAALQGLRQRAQGGAPPQPQPGQGAGAPPGLSPAAMLADLTQAIIQDVNTRGPAAVQEFVEAFQQFIEFFRQLLSQVGGGAPAQPAPGQVAPGGPPPPPMAGPPGPPPGMGGPPMMG